jgi:hypothetical protein
MATRITEFSGWNSSAGCPTLPAHTDIWGLNSCGKAVLYSAIHNLGPEVIARNSISLISIQTFFKNLVIHCTLKMPVKLRKRDECCKECSLTEQLPQQYYGKVQKENKRFDKLHETKERKLKMEKADIFRIDIFWKPKKCNYYYTNYHYYGLDLVARFCAKNLHLSVYISFSSGYAFSQFLLLFFPVISH